VVDRDLVVRAQGGDRDAFSALAAASVTGLYNLAQLMLDDGDAAQDVVQDALVSAWTNLRALRDPERFEPWLRRIVVRRVYTHARERSSRRSVSLEAAAVVPAGESGPPFESRDELDRCFLRLSAEHRAVLVVHHYLGLPDQEAADALGVPPGTLKSRLHRATQALRAELEAEARRSVAVPTGAAR